MHWSFLKTRFLCLFFLPSVISTASRRGNNEILESPYDYVEGSNTDFENSSARMLLKDQIQALASFILKNVSQICPLNHSETDYFERIEKLVLSTLSEIYNSEETLSRYTFYENIIPPVKNSLETCLMYPDSRISMEEYMKTEYPERILHIDLKHRFDVSKWKDFRPCIRTQIRSKFTPGLIPSAIDTLWQSFLLGYMGCSGHWGSIREWNYLDLVQQVLIRPLFQRWMVRQPQRNLKPEVNDDNGTLSHEIVDVLSHSGYEAESHISLKGLSEWLEKCNVILFLRHTVDPIPCFRSVIGRRV